jgi:thiamine kinase
VKTTTLKGLEKIAEGREAEIFAYGPDRVLRLYRPDYPDPEAAAERQTTVLRGAAAHGLRVPEVFGTETVGDRIGLILERLDGTDVFAVIAVKPWRLWNLSRLCGRLQAQLNEQPAPPNLTPLHEMLRDLIQRSGAPLEFKEAALSRLQSLPHGDRLYHGDFHPGNVMLGPNDDAVIIDWTGACRGVPEADFARTSMMMRLGDPPPGMPVLLRFFANFARFLLIGTYERAYRQARTVDEDLFLSFQLPIAVARFADNIPSEVPKLSRYVRQLIERDS